MEFSLRNTVAATLLASLALSACSGGSASGILPQNSAAIVSQPPSVPAPTSGQSIITNLYANSPFGVPASSAIVGKVATQERGASTLVATSYDLNGATTAVTTATIGNDNLMHYTVAAGNRTVHFSALAPSAIHAGVNQLPGGGTLTVDARTGNATADFTRGGVAYHIDAVRNSGGFYTVSLEGSNGVGWSQRVPQAVHGGPGVHALITWCQGLGAGAGILGGIASIAGGITVFAPNPVTATVGGIAAIAGGVLGIGAAVVCLM